MPAPDALDAARQRLATRHLPMAVARGAAWARYGGAQPQDLVGAAQLGLVKAAAAYRRVPRGRFTGWARTWIDGECRRELRAWGRYRGRCGSAEGLERVVAPPPAEDTSDLAAAWAALPDRERQVLMMRHGLGWTYAEAGRALGVSPQRAWQVEHAAIEALRAALDAGAPAG